MASIKIKNLPKGEKISRKEMGSILGGVAPTDPNVLGPSGGTAQDEIDAFVDANPQLLTPGTSVSDPKGTYTPPPDPICVDYPWVCR